MEKSSVVQSGSSGAVGGGTGSRVGGEELGGVLAGGSPSALESAGKGAFQLPGATGEEKLLAWL